jgi:hypothetical protein
MEELITSMGQKPEPIITIKNAIENIELRKTIFEKGFKLNLELPMVMYDTMTLAVISATSFMISTCIDFIKTPNQEGFEISLNKVSLVKTKDHLLFNNLRKFNESCKKGDVDKTLEFIISKNVKGFIGPASGTSVFVATVATTALALAIIPMIRELIFFFYYSRTRVSQYFDIQADLLQMNAHNVEINSTRDNETKKKIVSKQMGISKVFRDLANFFAVKGKVAETEARKEIQNSTKKYKIDDVVDSRPDSAADSLF